MILVLAGWLGIAVAVGLLRRHQRRGFVTLYRGLPYELPPGIELYQRAYYVSGVPAARCSRRRRDDVLDHKLRSRDDAVDLVDAARARAASRG